MTSLALRAAAKASAWLAAARHRARAARAGPAPAGAPRVFYGVQRVPGERAFAHGGMVRNQRLQGALPNEPYAFNVLYLASSTRPADSDALIRLARRKGAAFAWNQDGVGYPGWAPDPERVNAPMRRALQAADHVFYQSTFCKASADHWLGPAKGTSEVLHNAVDTRVFTPAEKPPEPEPLVVLLGGNQYEDYRLRSALETLAALVRGGADARLVVAGKLSWLPGAKRCAALARAWAQDLGVADRVAWRGPFAQAEAPDLYRGAHVLLHTKYKDPCPSVVVEALASGLPVVYGASGGLPELVGSEAGRGVLVEDTWDRQVAPDPQALTEAVLHVAERRDAYAKAARARAVERYDIRPFVARHVAVFEELLRRRAS